jgi:phospho-N-acetylmuramoyl-pentapeptide-transferase
MLLWLLHHFAPLLDRWELLSTGDSKVFVTARTALASLTSFLIAFLLGPMIIRWLKARRVGERIASDSERLNELHASKNDTPTMGGLFIIGAIVVSVLLWSDLSSQYVRLSLILTIGFGALGAVDDWVKLRRQRNGLGAGQKLGVQVGLSLFIGVLLYLHHQPTQFGLSLVSPFGGGTIWLGAGFALWAMLVLVASSNAVNLTDGLDGLAGGCLVFAGSAFLALTYLAGHMKLAGYLSIPYMPGTGELTVVMGAMVGAVMGFLWFNCYPAEVFMGDTGSLPLGGLIGLAALAVRQELLLVIIGGVFVTETLSVIAQVFWFRWTGRRILACSPLHNHFLFRGQHEMKIVVRFWLTAALLAIAGVASLKIK